MTEIHEAASNADLLKLEEAIKQGHDPDEPDLDWGRRTPLHVACAVGSKKCVYVLLTKGCSPNAKTDCGWTPAHFACEAGHSQCLQLLIAHDCDITAGDNYGDTALRVAQRHDHQDCIKIINEHLNEQ